MKNNQSQQTKQTFQMESGDIPIKSLSCSGELDGVKTADTYSPSGRGLLLQAVHHTGSLVHTLLPVFRK